MENALISSLIGLISGLVAALLVVRQQRESTKDIIAAEFNKLLQQHEFETTSRNRGRKEEWLLQAVPALIAAADPELHAKFNYTEIVTLIHKIQVILDPRQPLENQINSASSELGLAVQSVICGNLEPKSLLVAQHKLTEATRAFLGNSPNQLDRVN